MLLWLLVFHGIFVPPISYAMGPFINYVTPKGGGGGGGGRGSEQL